MEKVRKTMIELGLQMCTLFLVQTCVLVCLFRHTRLKKSKIREQKTINYRGSGEEALGETIGLIEQGFLIAELLHIMFEDCETVDTITVETNRWETINKHLRKKYHARSKIEIQFSSCFKGGKRY